MKNDENNVIDVETKMSEIVKNTMYTISGTVGKIRNDPKAKTLEINVDISKIKLSDLIEYALRPVIIKNANNVRKTWKQTDKTFKQSVENNPHYNVGKDKIVETLQPISQKTSKPKSEKLIDIVNDMNINELKTLVDNMDNDNPNYQLFNMLLKMKQQQ